MTLKDVADEAKVSTATASLALSGKGRISQEVVEKVIRAADKIGYKKKPRIATSRSKNSRTIAFLHLVYFPITWMFERSFILQIEKSLKEHNLYPILINISQYNSYEDILDAIIQSGAKGVFSIHYAHEDLFSALEEQGIPVVIINDSGYQDRFNSVLVDDFQGGYEAALYLIKQGHKRIGFLPFDDVEFNHVNLPNCVSDRFIGFKKALDEHNLEFSEDLMIPIESKNFEKTVQQLASVFSKPDPPTALVVFDDHLAACVYAGLEKLKLRIPEDVSLIAGGDNLMYSLPFTPQISTMQINSAMMGKLACDLLVSRLKKPLQEIRVVKMKQQFVERGSCRNIT